MSPELLVCGNIARDIIFGHEKFGGSAAVIAINTQRLGVSSGLLSIIGQDPFSNKYWQYLKENGVDLELVRQCSDRLPECIVSSQGNNHTNVEWIDYGCHEAMETVKIDPKLVLRHKIVHLVSCPPHLARKLAEMGGQLSYEPGPYINSSSDYLDPVVIKKSRLIFFNEDELQSALTISGFKSPRDFVTESNQVLVVTRGKNGSDLYLRSGKGFKILHINATSPRRKVIDYTGAGDCYKAGFLSAYIWGRSLQECAIIGSHLGAACLVQEGGLLPESELMKVKCSQ